MMVAVALAVVFAAEEGHVLENRQGRGSEGQGLGP